MQDSAFAAALRLCGEKPITLPSGLLLLNRKVAGVPVLMLPRAAPPADLPAQLAQAGISRRLLLLSPERPCDMPRALQISPARNQLFVNLIEDDATRRAALHQKWRNQLKRAEDSPLRILHRPMTLDHPLLEMEKEQARTRRYQNWPTPLTIAFTQAAPEKTHLFTAILRGHTVAHMLFLTHGSSATYHIGHTTQNGRSAHAHNLILWHAMQRLHKMGITELNLGPETTPEIDRFKRRVGAKVEPSGGTWLRWTPLASRKAG
jgi:hypothetical protein